MDLEQAIAAREDEIRSLRDRPWAVWLMKQRKNGKNQEKKNRPDLGDIIDEVYLNTLDCIITCAKRG